MIQEAIEFLNHDFFLHTMLMIYPFCWLIIGLPSPRFSTGVPNHIIPNSKNKHQTTPKKISSLVPTPAGPLFLKVQEPHFLLFLLLKGDLETYCNLLLDFPFESLGYFGYNTYQLDYAISTSKCHPSCIAGCHLLHLSWNKWTLSS